MRPTAWLRRRLTRVATGGRLDEAPRTLEEAARAGATDYVLKPFDPIALADQVAAHLSARSGS